MRSVLLALTLTSAVALRGAPAQGAWDRQLLPVNLHLNVPARRLEVRVGDSLVRSLPVAAGMRTYPTPRGDFVVTSVEFSPWWYPPDQPWARGEKVRPPGGDNPMGRVKLAFGRGFFLHGTPNPRSIGRLESHGCVRMQNEDALWLARLLLSHHAPAVNDSLVAAHAADSATPHRHVLTTPAGLRNTYETVEVRSDTLYVWRDAYRRGTTTIPRILSRLSAVGFDTTRVNRPVLRRVVARSATRDQRLALTELREP